MLDTKIQDAINDQINWELYSGYLYLSMAAQFSELGMPGGQNWMTVQYQEELAHAQKMFDYVTTRGGRVTLEAIAKPQTEWAVGLDMFKEALAHEEKVTARIFDLASLALGAQGPRHVQLPAVVHRRAGRGRRERQRHGAKIHHGGRPAGRPLPARQGARGARVHAAGARRVRAVTAP